MSRGALWRDDQCGTLSYGKAKLYGMPHVGARYRRDDIESHTWDGDWPKCAVCGRTDGPHEVHHEPPRSNGSFLLRTPMGQHVLLPALLTLCKGCHSARHSEGTLKVDWLWDSEELERMWWDGTYLKSLPPHGDWLWAKGRYRFELNGVSWDYREVPGSGWTSMPGWLAAPILSARTADERREALKEAAKERIGWTGDGD